MEDEYSPLLERHKALEHQHKIVTISLASAEESLQELT
jgi:hypothetical protein